MLNIFIGIVIGISLIKFDIINNISDKLSEFEIVYQSSHNQNNVRLLQFYDRWGSPTVGQGYCKNW